MTDNTDNPAFPIIEFLNEKIKESDGAKTYWEENHQKPMAYYFRNMAIHRIAAFKEVLEFINENFNEND
jgi:hypothetical protein